MPVVTSCGYRAPFWLPGGDLQTLGARLVSAVPRPGYVREVLSLVDGDTIFVDWLYASGSARRRASCLAILSHGLEGNSQRSYMRAMAFACAQRGWDVAARNFRGCGGPVNGLPVLYHSGDVADLDTVVRHAAGLGYTAISLVGFSMGGNQVLLYMGKYASCLPDEVRCAATISVPCDLAGCARVLARPRNRFYMEYFLRTLRQKIRKKHNSHPALFPIKHLDAMKTFKAFDDAFTAPLNGFTDAEDYWAKSSAAPWIEAITRPALLVSALNDPFLSPECYPVLAAKNSPHLTLMMPEEGGHVGFPSVSGRAGGWLGETLTGFLAPALEA